MNELYEQFGETPMLQKQALFANLFILGNRIQTAYEKEQGELTMKQWLMLALLGVCPKPHTLTNVGVYLGCSRQNTKQLAMALSKKGYVRLVLGAQNSVHIEPTEKVTAHEREMGERYAQVLHLLFSDFSEEELARFYQLFNKLHTGVERIEKGVHL